MHSSPHSSGTSSSPTTSTNIHFFEPKCRRKSTIQLTWVAFSLGFVVVLAIYDPGDVFCRIPGARVSKYIVGGGSRESGG